MGTPAWQKSHPEQLRAYRRDWKRRNRPAVLAHKRVARAIASGRLVRPTKCERCPEVCKPGAHHEDYSRPLDVEFLCARCHKAAHGKG